jgi:hypothetical protein
MSDQPAIVLFTAKSAERILREGGTSSWRLDRNHARRCTHAVCVRNTRATWGDGTEEHHVAFLVGKVSGVEPTAPTPENNESPEDRYLIRFSEYARINVPNSWPKGYRNPVRYSSLEDLGIDPVMLKWEAMPEPAEALACAQDELDVGAVNVSSGEALTIAQAKRGLALTFRVPVEAVEITIRG